MPFDVICFTFLSHSQIPLMFSGEQELLTTKESGMFKIPRSLKVFFLSFTFLVLLTARPRGPPSLKYTSNRYTMSCIFFYILHRLLVKFLGS